MPTAIEYAKMPKKKVKPKKSSVKSCLKVTCFIYCFIFFRVLQKFFKLIKIKFKNKIRKINQKKLIIKSHKSLNKIIKRNWNLILIQIKTQIPKNHWKNISPINNISNNLFQRNLNLIILIRKQTIIHNKHNKHKKHNKHNQHIKNNKQNKIDQIKNQNKALLKNNNLTKIQPPKLHLLS